MTLMALHHTPITNKPLIITPETPVCRIRGACGSLSFNPINVLNGVARFGVITDVKELTQELRDMEFVFTCVVGCVNFHNVVENAFC